MRLFGHITTAISGMLLLSGGAYSAVYASTTAPESKSRQMMERFDERFALMDSLVFRNTMPAETFAELDSAAVQIMVAQRAEVIDEAVEAEVRAMKARTGLELRGQAYVRPGRQISYDPDDPLVAYNAKVSAELDWNIFQSSIYKRASRIEELRLQGELRQLEYEREALNSTLFLQNNSVRTRHYGRLLSLLNIRAENVKLLMETQMFLLQNGKISSDDLLKAINEQAEIERQLAVFDADTTIVPLPVSTSAVYISVADTTGLMECVREQHRDIRKLTIQQELLDAKRRNIDYWQTMNITPFIRYSWYNRPDVRNTYNIDIGVSFRLPLSAETSRKRKAIAAEKNVIISEQETAGMLVERDVWDMLREMESINENIYGEYERMQSLKRYLRMRIDSYRNVAGDYSRIDRLQEYNAWLQAWERMLGYLYRRDMLLIELQSCIPNEPISKFLIFQELNQ